MSGPRRIIIWDAPPVRRNAMPESLRDIDIWPSIDKSALPPAQRAAYDKNEQAVRLFVADDRVSMREIERRTGVKPEQLYRLLGRCLARDSDGRIQGLRGLMPYKRVKGYERSDGVGTAPPRARGGAAGAFGALLSRYPMLEQWLKKRARVYAKPLHGSIREVRPALRRLHKQFLDKCREAGLAEKDYPFNRDMQGLRSLQTFLKAHAADVEAKSIDKAPSADTEDGFDTGVPKPTLPFDAVQFDGHKIDLRLTVKYRDTSGMEVLSELTRIYILVCRDVVTRGVLGYQLALAAEYDSDDVAMALQSCFGARAAPTFTIPALSVRKGGGFPRDLFDEARYPAWRWFQFDNARAHLAEATLTRLVSIVGCFVHTGRLGHPNDRSIIERFFSTLARFGFHQLPGSTGSSTRDEVRALADVGKEVRLLMTIDELEQVVYVMLADFNGESNGALAGRSPNEAMAYWFAKPGFVAWDLPPAKRQQMIFLQDARSVKVTGPRPHVNFEGVSYTSDVLSKHPELVGRRLRMYFNVKDIRQVQAYFDDGTELGTLIASKSWRTVAHSLRQRQEILRLERIGKLRYREGEDAIEAYAKYKRRQARTNKRSANALAKLEQTREQAVPTQSQPQPEGEKSAVEVEAPGLRAPPADEQPGAKPKPRTLRIRKTVVFGGRS